MTIFLAIPLFLFGLIIGSFLNVLIWRLNDEKAPKFWQGRSVCPKCRHQLSWKENIPLLSFLSLGGRCRYCKKKISWQYPIVELVTAIATVLTVSYLSHLSFLSLLSYLIIIYSFIVIFFSDLKYQLIPDEMVILIIILSGLSWNVLVGFLTALGFFLVVLVTKFRGMGLGDVKLAFAMGLLLGFPAVVVAVWFGFVLGGVFAVGLLLLHRKKIRETMALGPFLVLGSLIAALWSDEVLKLVGY